MNTTDTTDTTPGSSPENTPSDQSRPFGFWIRAVDRLLAAEFATAFEDEGITRRDWRIFNVIGGTVPRSGEIPDRKLHHLAALGWIERTADGWTLTADGTAAQARLTAAVAEIRAQVADWIEPEELAAMAASLEKLARGLGYEEGARLPRRPGARHGDDHGRGGHGRHHRRGHDRGHRGHGLRDHGEEHFGHGEHRRGFGRGDGDGERRREAGFGHGEHRHGFGHGGERFGHDEHCERRGGFERRRDAGFGHGNRGDGPAARERGGEPCGERGGFGHEFPHREHRYDEHPRHERHPHREHRPHGEHGGRGRGPAEAAPAHLHIHLHDGRRNG